MQEKYKNIPQKETDVDKRQSIAVQVELVEINHIIQSRRDKPIDSYIELDTMIKRVNNERKKLN